MPTLLAGFDDRLLRVSRDGDGWTATTVREGDDLQAVGAHRGAPERWFVGTFDRGLQRTLDGGASWEAVGTDTIEPDAVTSVAVDPSDPGVVYAGTEPSRVYRSTDGGASWRHLEGLTDLPSADRWSFPPRPSTHHVRWIEVNPANPEHLYVSIEAGALVQSPDGGKTWTDRVADSRRDNHELTTHPAAPGHAWAAAGDGFAETADGGETWQHPQRGLEHRYCWSVAADPADPDRLLLSAARGPGRAHTPGRAESYVYRREIHDLDGEAVWARSGEGLPDGHGMLRPVLERGENPGAVFAATNLGLFRTDSMGQEWHALALEWPSALESQPPSGLVVLF
ncbi:MAG: hypothetical protein ABEI31_08780 [Halodesulfurarchaeum sp.]